MANKVRTRVQVKTTSICLNFIFKDPFFAVVFHPHTENTNAEKNHTPTPSITRQHGQKLFAAAHTPVAL